MVDTLGSVVDTVCDLVDTSSFIKKLYEWLFRSAANFVDVFHVL